MIRGLRTDARSSELLAIGSYLQELVPVHSGHELVLADHQAGVRLHLDTAGWSRCHCGEKCLKLKRQNILFSLKINYVPYCWGTFNTAGYIISI